MDREELSDMCVDLLRELIKDQTYSVLVSTGAGISASCGVPTFQATGRLWRGEPIEELLTPERLATDPASVWAWHLELRQALSHCEPSRAHHLLAKWAKERTNVELVTQNIDGLHERAGHPDVIRFHGSVWRNRCTVCHLEREDTALSYNTLPTCPACGALERPAVVLYGESIPDEAHARACINAIRAKLVIIIGTSGMVMPAALIPNIARAHGAVIADINPHENDVDAVLKIRLNADEALERLFA
ncbi:MAG: Sir2 family NAD-dependent protein deacetylase [Patescibacteria group bacterium]